MMFWCDDLTIWWDDVTMWRVRRTHRRKSVSCEHFRQSSWLRRIRALSRFEPNPFFLQKLSSFGGFVFFFFREVSESGKLPIPLARCVAGLLPFSFILLTSESACGAKNSANVSRQRKMFLNCNQPLFSSESHFRKSFESSFSFSLGAEFPNKDLRSNCFRFRSKGHRLYWA